MISRSRYNCTAQHCLPGTQPESFDILQTEVLAEGEMMIPNTKQRVMAAADALSTFIVSDSECRCCVDSNGLTSLSHATQDSNEDAIGSTTKLTEAKQLLSEILGDTGAAGGDEEEI